MRRMLAVAVMVFAAVTVNAAKVTCDDDLPHVISVGVPRTSMSDAEAARLPQLLQQTFGPAYADKCGAGKDLQIHLAFGSDYEVLDWLERGSVDAGIVPHLSLFLLTNRNHESFGELDEATASTIGILRPLAPAPECRTYANRQWRACDPRQALDRYIDALAKGEDGGDTRLMFASHLSSTGFLAPVEHAATRLAELRVDEPTFWNRFFAKARYRIDSSPDLDPFRLALAEEKVASTLTVIAYPGEETLLLTNAQPGAYRQHFVIARDAASLLPHARFTDAWNGNRPSIDPHVTELLLNREAPAAFAELTQPNATYGTRTFAFTIRESLRLLQQQQRSSGLDELALVLPGGGVKAAYQSRLIDFLYVNNLLRNAEAGGGAKTLHVRTVLGTSGGALLGYFVSQLSDKGPFRLFDILWRPGGELLDASHVFGWTDMLRYVSIAWTFFVFCAVLAFLTGRFNSPFYKRGQTPIGAWRARMLPLLIVFLAVPVLIRVATRSADSEHVPVIEGIFYTMLTLLVMFADQCLIHVRQGREERRLRWHVLVLFILGAGFVVASMSGIAREVPFLFAFGTLATIFIGAPFVLLWASNKFGDPWHRGIDVLGSLFVIAMLCAFGVPGRAEMPHLVALLVLILLAILAYLYAQQEQRTRIVATLLTFTSLIVAAVLCWSEQVRPESWRPSLAYFAANAFENTKYAPFLASTGCLLLVIAAMVWVYQNERFALRSGEDFALGLGLLVTHALATMVIVLVAALLVPGTVHNVEMTLSFWVALTLTGLILAGTIVLMAPRYEIMRRAVRFLRAEHPNGALMPRRYARMLVIAGVSVIWWNVIVAPALYGNRMARRYLNHAVIHFDDAFRKVNGEAPSDDPRGFVPTARFVTPANTLDVESSTRYFLFETPDHVPPAASKRIAGARWNMYETTPRWLGDNDCRFLIDPGCVTFVHDVIFSSGSPFPIFAAHRVEMPGEGPVDLIDGGYSNVIPIDAARQVAARQALIVHSSSPIAAPEDPWPALLSPGLLVRNAGRLPAFMFERGQLVDRISRQDLFVISLAPKLAPGEAWPGLAQFDAATVQHLLDKANANLYERIGFVESWGEPRFRVSVQAPAVVLTLTRARPGARG